MDNRKVKLDYKLVRLIVVVLCSILCLNLVDASRKRPGKSYSDLFRSMMFLEHQLDSCRGMFLCDVFRGHEAHCIELHNVCDGHPQCINGEDERNCKTKSPKCDYFQMLCPDQKTCAVPCNGITECPSGIDERTCGKTCQRGEVKCSNDACAVVGNGISECDDDADELCLKCKAGEIPCKRKGKTTEECVPVCDGAVDCENGQDEYPLLQSCLKCKAGEIPCKRRGKMAEECVPVCDGTVDCENGFDEYPILERCSLNCDGRRVECELVSGGMGCVEVCDGIPQCKDNEELDSARCEVLDGLPICALETDCYVSLSLGTCCACGLEVFVCQRKP